MQEHLVFSITLIGVVGIGAQWLGWRFNLPAIVLMAIAGLFLGPILGIMRPEETFGDFYQPIIAVAVAVILFEGGLQLRLDELRGLGKGVRRLVFPGVPIAWLLGAGAAHVIGGLGWSASVLFGGIMVVTGPTVIIPLLRQAKLSSRPAALLKWEGIVNDPIGALAAVIAYEFFFAPNTGEHDLTTAQLAASLLIGSVLCLLEGIAFGLGIARAFRKGWVPEYLKPPVLLAAVLLCFELANLLQEEGGLISVTAMGVTMANAKMPSINQLRHFKENIAVLFVSGVFVLLTANLTPETLMLLDWRAGAFVLAMLFVVRPLTVWIATIGTGLPWQERALVGWIAPRGIVAVAVSGLFAAGMEQRGDADGEMLVPLAFAMVFATVLLHGFTIAPLAKLLGLASTRPPGVLIVGSSPWSVKLAEKLKELDLPVLISDASYRALRPARQAGIDTFYGEILSEVTEHHIEFVRYGYLLALGGNEAHNALVCTDLAPEMDRATTYQLSMQGTEDSRKGISYSLQGKTFISEKTSLDTLLQKHYSGWTFQFTRLSEAYPPDRYRAALPTEAMIVLVVRRDQLLFQSAEQRLELTVGDRVLAYVPPGTGTKPKEEPSQENRSPEIEALEERKRAALEKVGG
ncbi:cation:proton antiporter [Parvularcula dongshanensis]|uniref:NhaP-type Na+/H+ or K+/H+ antiporter n=1 Tax=Parvularcula dongshanensis TaxID=1173995 RepID=A0A840I5Y3_9PROT|nr:sodium:proton antiporter [Parvularcula dongshanensis]MBB4659822.1 NhaP-type Na+/H+ or K+/H+ antiporter [Parvularcula dongshanensis]